MSTPTAFDMATPLAESAPQGARTRRTPADELALLLAESASAVGEPRAHAELLAVGITGDAVTGGAPLDALHWEAVIPTTPGRFALARDQRDQRGAVPAFVFAVRDAHGDLADLAAWTPPAPLPRLMLGVAAMLGAEQMFAPRIEPLFAFETVLEWLQAGRQGVVILDDRLAGPALDGVTLATSTAAFARQLRARLAPFTIRLPRVLIPRQAAHA